jgi:hypothetical protein
MVSSSKLHEAQNNAAARPTPRDARNKDDDDTVTARGANAAAWGRTAKPRAHTPCGGAKGQGGTTGDPSKGEKLEKEEEEKGT